MDSPLRQINGKDYYASDDIEANLTEQFLSGCRVDNDNIKILDVRHDEYSDEFILEREWEFCLDALQGFQAELYDVIKRMENCKISNRMDEYHTLEMEKADLEYEISLVKQDLVELEELMNDKE